MDKVFQKQNEIQERLAQLELNVGHIQNSGAGDSVPDRFSQVESVVKAREITRKLQYQRDILARNVESLNFLSVLEKISS